MYSFGRTAKSVVKTTWTYWSFSCLPDTEIYMHMYSLDGRRSQLLKLHVHTGVLAVYRTREFTCTCTVLDGRRSQLLKLHVHTGVLAVYRTRE